MRWVALLFAMTLALALVFGAPRVAGLSWGTGYYDAVQSRQTAQVEMSRIEADRDVRIAQEREATARTWAVYLPLAIVAVGIVVIGWRVAGRATYAHPQPPARLLAYARRYPSTEVAIVDGEWALVDATGDWRTLAQLEAMETKRIASRR